MKNHVEVHILTEANLVKGQVYGSPLAPTKYRYIEKFMDNLCVYARITEDNIPGARPLEIRMSRFLLWINGNPDHNA